MVKALNLGELLTVEIGKVQRERERGRDDGDLSHHHPSLRGATIRETACPLEEGVWDDSSVRYSNGTPPPAHLVPLSTAAGSAWD